MNIAGRHVEPVLIGSRGRWRLLEAVARGSTKSWERVRFAVVRCGWRCTFPLSLSSAGLSEELKEDFRKVSSYCWKAKNL